VFRFKNKVRNECERNPGKGANKIYNELRKGVPVEVQIKAPFTMLESSLYARGRKIHPKLPHTLEDVQEALEMEPDKDVFKYLKASVKYSSRFGGLIFGKDDLIAAFENTKDTAQDGTFKSCPTPFAQVYIMYFRKGRYFLPAFIIPLANKQKKLYLSTFRIVYKKLAPGFKGRRVHQDFELASKDATDIVLNECSVENEDRACLADCQCTGCHFHYRLIILRKFFFITIFFLNLQRGKLLEIFKILCNAKSRVYSVIWPQNSFLSSLLLLKLLKVSTRWSCFFRIPYFLLIFFFFEKIGLFEA
jgi:hypothetical protein